MTARQRLLAACALLLVAACALLLALQHARLASTFESRSRDRQVIVARDLAQSVEAQLALGLELSDAPTVAQLLARARQQSPGVQAVAVLDTRAQVLLAEEARWVATMRGPLRQHRRPSGPMPRAAPWAGGSARRARVRPLPWRWACPTRSARAPARWSCTTTTVPRARWRPRPLPGCGRWRWRPWRPG